jgi:hypothetical protein
MELEGSGPEIEFRNKEVSLGLASRHGLAVGQIGILALQAAGVPDAQIDIDPQFGGVRTQAVEISCEALWPFLKELFRPFGAAVMASRHDNVFRLILLEVGDQPELITLSARHDFNRCKFKAVDGPKCIRVTGHATGTGTGTGVGTGLVTSTVTVETFEDDFALPVPSAFQSAGVGAINVTGFGPPQAKDHVLTSRVTVEVTTEDGCEVQTVTRTEEYFNPQRARYAASATPSGLPTLYPVGTVHFFGVIPVTGDTTEGFFWDRSRFVLVSEVFSTPIWRDDGRRIGTAVRQNGWLNLNAAIKNGGGPDVDFETLPFIGGRWLTAGRQGVLFEYERYFIGPGAPDALYTAGSSSAYPGIPIVSRHLSADDETREVDECDYQPRNTIETTVYGRRPGLNNLYSDGVTSKDDILVGVTSSVTNLVTQINGRPVSVSLGKNTEGRSLPTTVTTGAGGGVPAAEICTPDTVDRDLKEKVSYKGRLERSDGKTVPGKEITITSPWPETVFECERYAKQELRLQNSFDVEISMVWPAPIVDAGSIVRIDQEGLVGRPDVKMVAWEVETTISGGSERTALQEIKCKLAP